MHRNEFSVTAQPIILECVILFIKLILFIITINLKADHAQIISKHNHYYVSLRVTIVALSVLVDNMLTWHISN